MKKLAMKLDTLSERMHRWLMKFEKWSDEWAIRREK